LQKSKENRKKKKKKAMQLVEVVLIYLHAAASEYAMHCEERNRQ